MQNEENDIDDGHSPNTASLDPIDVTKSYNEITKGYIYKWRENHPDKYNEYHRNTSKRPKTTSNKFRIL